MKLFKSSRPFTFGFALAFMLAAILALSLPLSGQKTGAHADDEKAVREALTQSATGFARNDLALLNKVWANDEALTVFEQGHANYGWVDYRDNHLVPEMREMKNTKYELSDMRVRLAGNTAWATFKYAISADVDKRHVDGGGLGTAVLEKRDGRWQIMHWHSSAPRRAPATAPAKKS